MKRKALGALKAGIAEWKLGRADVNYEREPCELCDVIDDCAECPLGTCNGRSPYDAALSAHLKARAYPNNKKAQATWKRKCTNMIRYMERRLPKCAKKRGEA